MIKWPWKIGEAAPLPLPWQQAMAIPLLDCLNESEQKALRLLAGRFLQQKRLVPLHDLQLDDIQRCRLALIFCLPVLQLGFEWLDGFNEVLLYPAPFIVEDEWQDEYGLIHREREVQSGQSWLQGHIVLNWLDVQDSFDLSGYNLIVHEVAHKLDSRGSGEATGIPAIPLREVAGWEKDLRSAMQDIQDEVDAVGENAASIDPYAASDAAECFAVLSEYFFTSPQILQERFPSLYRRLSQFYRQHPAERIIGVE